MDVVNPRQRHLEMGDFTISAKSTAAYHRLVAPSLTLAEAHDDLQARLSLEGRVEGKRIVLGAIPTEFFHLGFAEHADRLEIEGGEGLGFGKQPLLPYLVCCVDTATKLRHVVGATRTREQAQELNQAFKGEGWPRRAGGRTVSARYQVVPVYADHRRFMHRWNPTSHEATLREADYLIGLWASEIASLGVSVGDIIYVVRTDPGSARLVCRMTVTAVDPHPYEIEYEGRRMDVYDVEGSSATDLRDDLWLDADDFDDKLLFWRKSPQRPPELRGQIIRSKPDDPKRSPWRNHDQQQFLRPAVLQSDQDEESFLGQTLRRMSEIGSGAEFLDRLIETPSA